MSGPAPARRAAWRALVRLAGGQEALDDRGAALPELDALDERDRRLATELVMGTVKRRRSLDAVIAAFSEAPPTRIETDVREALRVSAYQLLFLDRVPAHAVVDDGVALVQTHGRRTRGFVNAVLRAVAREGRAQLAALTSAGDLEARALLWSCPTWLVARLEADLGPEAAAALLAAADRPPERCLRVNPLRGDMSAATSALRAAGFTTAPVSDLPDALLYEGPPLERSRPFTGGLVTPQSRGSQLVGQIAAGAEAAPPAILDLCAAPGIKTAQVAAAHPDARVTAVDLDPRRVEAMRANLRRLGADGVEVVCAEAGSLLPERAKSFDVALVDAPCTGLGTLGTRPDVRWRRREGDVARMAAEQRRLLAVGAACVRPGGALVYAVCTVTRAETVEVVDSLLSGGGWALDDLGAEVPGAAHPANGAFLLALPPDWGSTGFFVARLRRECA
ncbi:MAG TPA: transcription antitermination factor NusB [Thermoleophilia bacterium]|nr:transcription antitermination factor NusB [Thermoleophilia bacterium]